jgi:hypothetical protein
LRTQHRDLAWTLVHNTRPEAVLESEMIVAWIDGCHGG